MVSSPNNNKGDLVSITIYSNGEKLDDRVKVMGVNVTREVNKIGRAYITLLSSDDENLFEAEDAAFREGSVIRIESGYDGIESVIFEGLVNDQKLSNGSSGEIKLTINCAEFVVSTTKSAKKRIFNNVAGNAAIKGVFNEHGLLSEIDEMPVVNGNKVQNNITDWDFILRCVLDEGMIITTVNKKIIVTSPAIASNPILKVTYGEDIVSFDMTSNFDDVSSEPFRIMGKITFQGTALATPDTTIEICGLTKRVNGVAYISRVDHLIEDGNWITSVGIGYDEKKYSYSLAYQGIEGLYNGIIYNIIKYNTDEYSFGIELPLFDFQYNRVLAKLSSFYAGNDYGAFFTPEIGDEVIVGFLNDGQGTAVILGSVAKTVGEDNALKGIVTRSKLKMQFDDDNKIIKFETPGNNIIEIDDDSKSIRLKDQNGNKIIMSDNGISIESSKNLTFKAATDINITAGTAVNIKAGNNLNLKGITIEALADTSFVAKGNAQAELSASGQVTVKGAMVMIN